MNREARSSLKFFLIELLIYAVLVAVYFFLVLHFLGDWLEHLFAGNRRVYAFVALGLIVCQGIVLEMVTTGLLCWIKPREEEEE